MSVTRTFTVTVVSTGSGNKYVIDGVQQATINIAEGGTYRFDQSDSSNSNHPLRFSTTSGGTHSGGSEYTTGVTTNGTPGSSGAYTQITVATDAPTLYYYCTNHSGMGGQANTPTSDSWGMLAWNDNSWASNVATVVLTGVSATTSIGSITAFPEQGWGSDSWGDENWGESSFTVELSGVSATTAVGSVTVSAEINSGWGRQAWNDNAWGIQGTILLDGQQATASVGSLSPADVIGLTGVSATVSVGSITMIGSVVVEPTGVSSTASVGSLTASDVMRLTGVSATASVGSLSPADVIGVTGVSATTSIGDVSVTSNPSVIPTGLEMTSSVGSITPADVMGLTGVSATVSVGSLSPPVVMGLTGVSATASVAAFGTSSGFGIQAYQAIDTGSNTSYTDVAA